MLALPDADRAWLAEELLASFDGAADEGVQEAWTVEIERRISEVREGRVSLRSWDEVSAQLEALLDEP